MHSLLHPPSPLTLPGPLVPVPLFLLSILHLPLYVDLSDIILFSVGLKQFNLVVQLSKG